MTLRTRETKLDVLKSALQADRAAFAHGTGQRLTVTVDTVWYLTARSCPGLVDSIWVQLLSLIVPCSHVPGQIKFEVGCAVAVWVQSNVRVATLADSMWGPSTM